MERRIALGNDCMGHIGRTPALLVTAAALGAAAVVASMVSGDVGMVAVALVAWPLPALVVGASHGAVLAFRAFRSPCPAGPLGDGLPPLRLPPLGAAFAIAGFIIGAGALALGDRFTASTLGAGWLMSAVIVAFGANYRRMESLHNRIVRRRWPLRASQDHVETQRGLMDALAVVSAAWWAGLWIMPGVVGALFTTEGGAR